MNWHQPIDAYCERLDPSFWAEPVNALTNLGFMAVALALWPLMAGLGRARALCAILFAIGAGSFLFHTFATPLTALLDVAPIAAFILLYLFAVHRDLLGHGRGRAWLAVALFLPYAALVVLALRNAPFFGTSSFYWTVPILLLIYGAVLRGPLARDFAIGALLLAASISARSLDGALCDLVPFGTHFLWHLLNAVMLGWMIWVYRRHMLAGGAQGR